MAELDDLAQSYERVRELGFDTALAVGQYANDKELSFYARTSRDSHRGTPVERGEDV